VSGKWLTPNNQEKENIEATVLSLSPICLSLFSSLFPQGMTKSAGWTLKGSGNLLVAQHLWVGLGVYSYSSKVEVAAGCNSSSSNELTDQYRKLIRARPDSRISMTHKGTVR